MDGQQRGRSPSGGHQQLHINHGRSPSQSYQEPNPNDLGLGPDGALSGNSNSQPFSSGNYNSNQGLSFDTDNTFIPTQQDQIYPQGNLTEGFNGNQSFNHPDFNQFKQENIPTFGNQQASYPQDPLNSNTFNEGDFSLYSTPSGQGDQYDSSFFLNDTTQQAPPTQSINPAELMSDMSSPLSRPAPTPPHLLGPDTAQHPASAHQSPSFNHSPSLGQHQFSHSPSHSRHTSLGPESAAFPQVQMSNDWSGMMQPQFTTHRRSPSEYSDVSVSSAAPSPNLVHHETFDSIESQHSPLLNSQDANLYADGLGIGSFSLSDSHQRSRSPGRGTSPAHTPSISPRLGPQQVPMMTPQTQFLLSMGFPQSSEVYGQIPEQYGNLNRSGSVEMGQATQMVPPEINVEFAPASRQNSFEPPKPSLDQDALTPPDRGKICIIFPMRTITDQIPLGRRRRAVSDPYNSGSSIVPRTSSMTPGIGSSTSLSPARSLSPLDRSGASSPSSRRRQSTSSLPNRDYILGLADPEYQAASGGSENGNVKRAQKHPATFQCTLCPKRFTRAYNLRSHLRTHTDERPFVCTVCGKAFARQHDRKRHEGLHSGEKKFVCKGELKQGGQWGCGRRFARADALGRHFRSEAGRVCIKPLLDEEAIERQRLWQEQQMQNMAHNMQQQPQPMVVDASGFPMDTNGNYSLPAALLAQYPALATLTWSDLPQGEGAMDDDISGRSSFEASGSEYYEEENDGGYVSGPGTSYGQGQMNEAYSGKLSGEYR